jgi:hypothetical protein
MAVARERYRVICRGRDVHAVPQHEARIAAPVSGTTSELAADVIAQVMTSPFVRKATAWRLPNAICAVSACAAGAAGTRNVRTRVREMIVVTNRTP